MELRDKTKRPVKKLLSSSLNKLPALVQRPNRFFAETNPANTKNLASLEVRVFENMEGSSDMMEIFLGDVDFTTAWKQSNAVNWIVEKNLFTRLKVVLVTSES